MTGYDRFLTARGAGEAGYLITLAGGEAVASFITTGVNGKTPDDTAIGNLLDFSENGPYGGRLTLRRIELPGPGMRKLAEAEHGIGYLPTPTLADHVPGPRVGGTCF